MLEQLRVASYRFSLTVQEQLELPRFKGNILRGAFGATFKRLVCAQKDAQQACSTCLLQSTCAYSYIFETRRPASAEVLHGYTEIPHPFVLEPPLDGRTSYQPGETLPLGLILVGRAIAYLPYFIIVLSALGEQGLGRQRACYTLSTVHAIQPFSQQEMLVYGDANHSLRSHDLSVGWGDISAVDAATVPQVVIRFMTPTRLVSNDHLVDKPTFQQIIRGLLRRTSSLSYFHCESRLDVDFAGLIAGAREVGCSGLDMTWVDWERYSSRQGVRMKLGGFIGEAVYTGELKPFLPLLRLGEIVHVGKASTFGNGKYRLLPQTMGSLFHRQTADLAAG